MTSTEFEMVTFETEQHEIKELLINTLIKILKSNVETPQKNNFGDIVKAGKLYWELDRENELGFWSYLRDDDDIDWDSICPVYKNARFGFGHTEQPLYRMLTAVLDCVGVREYGKVLINKI